MANLGSDGKKAGRVLKIGTRGSPLALIQAHEARERLAQAHSFLSPPEAIEIVVIKTTGDKVQDRALAEIGGKSLFTKEIEEALLAGTIDLAVHSMKDVPTELPKGLVIAGLLQREDPRDALIAGSVKRIADLPQGGVIGTASLRRQAQLLALRPDLKIVTLRGNVDTRLAKVARGEVAATILAIAGLKRLGKSEAASAVLSVDEMLPAVAQGAIGLEARDGDSRILELVASINHGATENAVITERACLHELEGSCRTPIAAYAEVSNNQISLRALVAMPDGSEVHRSDALGDISDRVRIGEEVGRRLKSLAGPKFKA